MPDDRPRRPFNPQRPRPGGGAPTFTPRGAGAAPFTPRPAVAPVAPRVPSEQPHSVRLRDGDREIEVSGSPGFVRQLLDDLPALMGRLRADSPASRPASISMPPAPAPAPAPARTPTPSMPPPPTLPAASAAAPVAEQAPAAAEPVDEAPAAPPATNGKAPVDPLTRQVLGIMRKSSRPMGIAEIRKRLPDTVSGQQVRRVLERASEQVVNTGGRPAEYRLR
ncbi:MAG TPA: hypothetical protein VH134_15215 [Candidatus Dormibacteraeota bacterium]|nr:hypothetical protein [Candidatus Dormibacteraeota bacterium]